MLSRPERPDFFFRAELWRVGPFFILSSRPEQRRLLPLRSGGIMAKRLTRAPHAAPRVRESYPSRHFERSLRSEKSPFDLSRQMPVLYLGFLLTPPHS